MESHWGVANCTCIMIWLVGYRSPLAAMETSLCGLWSLHQKRQDFPLWTRPWMFQRRYSTSFPISSTQFPSCWLIIFFIYNYATIIFWTQNTFSYHITTSRYCLLPLVPRAKVLVLVTPLCATLRDPMDGSLPGSDVHGIFQVLEIGVSGHALLKGIFLIQGLNLGLPHCRQIFYHLSQKGITNCSSICYPLSVNLLFIVSGDSTLICFLLCYFAKFIFIQNYISIFFNT